jgi:hypothetical protein
MLTGDTCVLVKLCRKDATVDIFIKHNMVDLLDKACVVCFMLIRVDGYLIVTFAGNT